ncbi:hypothetical protein [Dyadobacter bucti]|uniref:hypothetical protein n=1 Tax=Dyadobacter bucti TaxID=2572203 RepID=UPI001108F60D|nr:hypothetical protein [Dyadobacter bucti]
MKKQRNLLPFEHVLQAYVTARGEIAAGISDELEASFVFGQPVTTELPANKANKLLQALTLELSKASLGIIVQQAAAVKQLSDEMLQEKTGLTPSLLSAIRTDMVFTNSIPVKSLVKLLKLLDLGIDNTMTAIKVTFDKLQAENSTMSLGNLNFQPAFRKGVIRGDFGKDLSGIKSDESFLYQNEEALTNYTNRLTELYTTL